MQQTELEEVGKQIAGLIQRYWELVSPSEKEVGMAVRRLAC